MANVTLADIARLAGVSRTTASYVVNGKADAHRISAATVERVRQVVRDHAYKVDAQAAALRRGATHTLGLIVPDLANASYARLAQLIEGGARAAGYHVFIACSDDDPATERELAQRLQAQRCDGLIVASCLAMADPLYADLMAQGLPIVGMDRPMDSDRFCWVASGNQSAAYTLTESIVHRDMRQLLWLDALPELSITRRRRAGFDAAVAACAPQARVIRLTGNRYDQASGQALMQRYLQSHPVPDALVTAAYPLIDGALDVLLDAARSGDPLPGIATFGDNRVLDFLPTRISSAVQQHEQVAQQVLQRMLDALAGRYQPGHDRIPRLLRQRENRSSAIRSPTHTLV